MKGSKSETVGFFLAGALLGGAIGILCAPASGERTRKRIKRQARRGMEHLDELQDDIRLRLNDWIEDVADTVDEGLVRGKKLSLAGKERVLGVFDDARERLETGRQRIERFIQASE
jgi:gas vesicle protein